MAAPLLDGRVFIPGEILEDIAFALLAASPLQSPAPIIPLLQTSRAFLLILSPRSSTTLYARLCRLKFDLGATERRSTSPNNRKLTELFVRMSTSLRCIRRGDIFAEDLTNTMLDMFFMVMHNDGKNLAQLDNVGAVEFLDKFIRLRLHEGKESNDMWPLENTRNSAALWLSWFFTTTDQLEKESLQQKNQLIDLILPYILCPHRYASAYAPVNHFVLPLQQHYQSLKTAHGLYPVYHTGNLEPRCSPLFQSETTILLPPISAAAKLLFWCRREVNTPFRAPAGLPANRASLGGLPGVTLEDIEDLNSFRIAIPSTAVRWDWNQGFASHFSEEDSQGRRTEDHSRRWDIDWWRINMCHSVLKKQPRWRPGSVYHRGLLTGLWQGVYLMSSVETSEELLRTTRYQDTTSVFSELFARPIVMRLREHGHVQTPMLSQSFGDECTSYGGYGCRATTIAAPTSEHPSFHTHKPHGFKEADDPAEPSINNAWIPGPVGSLRWSTTRRASPLREADSLASSRERSKEGAMGFVQFDVPSGFSTDPVDSSQNTEHDLLHPTYRLWATGDHAIYETYEPGKQSVHDRMTRSKEEGAFCECGELFYPGCPRCNDRETFLRERERAEESRRRSTPPVTLSDNEEEEIFRSIGMGKAMSPGEDYTHCLTEFDEQQWDRVEECDGGVEDTIITGEMDDNHRLAWGESVYYGRVRPWDGLIALLKRTGQDDERRSGNYVLYGYVYGGDTFVGNWRLASGDPSLPAFENPVIMRKRPET